MMPLTDCPNWVGRLAKQADPPRRRKGFRLCALRMRSRELTLHDFAGWPAELIAAEVARCPPHPAARVGCEAIEPTGTSALKR